MDKEARNNTIFLFVIGAVGVLMEVIGLGWVFAWTQDIPRSFSDPRLIVGLLAAFAGFVILTRIFARIAKTVIKVLAAPTA